MRSLSAQFLDSRASIALLDKLTHLRRLCDGSGSANAGCRTNSSRYALKSVSVGCDSKQCQSTSAIVLTFPAA